MSLWKRQTSISRTLLESLILHLNWSQLNRLLMFLKMSPNNDWWNNILFSISPPPPHLNVKIVINPCLIKLIMAIFARVLKATYVTHPSHLIVKLVNHPCSWKAFEPSDKGHYFVVLKAFNTYFKQIRLSTCLFHLYQRTIGNVSTTGPRFRFINSVTRYVCMFQKFCPVSEWKLTVDNFDSITGQCPIEKSRMWQ